MSRSAFLVGGTGQIGRAVALDLLERGWDVTVSHRGRRTPPAELVERGAKVVVLDREEPGALARGLAGGADAVIDTVAFTDEHAGQLLDIQGDVGAFVVVSSASVYRDALGRILEDGATKGFPDLPVPVPETHPTVDPGPASYSTRKAALERRLLDHSRRPVTVLRPCAIYGPETQHPREWWFVKRILDGRPAVPLAYRGQSRFHTASVDNIATLTRAALEHPETRVWNAADADAPTVAEIGAAVARHLGYEGVFIEVDADVPFPPPVGGTPWSVTRPFVVDVRAAEPWIDTPLATYAESAAAACDWLVRTAGEGDWKVRFPVLAGYPYDHFDYAAEDRFFKAADLGPHGAPR